MFAGQSDFFFSPLECQKIPSGSSLSSAVSVLQLHCSQALKTDSSTSPRIMDGDISRGPIDSCDGLSGVLRYCVGSCGACGRELFDVSSLVDLFWKGNGDVVRDNVSNLTSSWMPSGIVPMSQMMRPSSLLPMPLLLEIRNSFQLMTIQRGFSRWYADCPFLTMCNVTTEFSSYRIGASRFCSRSALHPFREVRRRRGRLSGWGR